METELCELAYKYGSDKCRKVKHFYTEYYWKLLKDKRDTIKKVLEVGVGYPEDMKHAPKHYVIGASLFMWRDFFPNAQIYGADIVSRCIFERERIKTFICNQNSNRDLVRLLKWTGRDIDLFIDDGSHMTSDQIFTAQTLLPRLKEDVIYIIEDVRESKSIISSLPQYKCTLIERKERVSQDDRLVLIQRK